MFLEKMKVYVPDLRDYLEKIDIENIKIMKNKIDSQVSESNDEIFRMYEYMNGEKENQVLMLMCGFTYLTIKQVIKEYDYLKTVDIVLETSNTDQIQKRSMKELCWVPFAYDFSNCYFVVDMTPSESGKIGQVIGIDLEFRKAYLLAESLNDFLGKMIEYLENGLCVVEQEGDDVFINAKSGHFFNSIKEMLE